MLLCFSFDKNEWFTESRKIIENGTCTFELKNLKEHFINYSLWIAAYSGKHRVVGVDWQFHQFTEKVIVKGIKTSVDGNDFIGSLEDLETFRMR